MRRWRALHQLTIQFQTGMPVLCWGTRYGIVIGRLYYIPRGIDDDRSPCDCPGELPHRIGVSVRWPDGAEQRVAVPHISVLTN